MSRVLLPTLDVSFPLSVHTALGKKRDRGVLLSRLCYATSTRIDRECFVLDRNVCFIYPTPRSVLVLGFDPHIVQVLLPRCRPYRRALRQKKFLNLRSRVVGRRAREKCVEMFLYCTRV